MEKAPISQKGPEGWLICLLPLKKIVLLCTALFPLSLWSASWLPPSQKDHSVIRQSHWDIGGHVVSLVMPEWSDFHFNVTLLISQRCNVQDTKALSGLHISLIPYAFTHVIITIALHISISAFWGAIRVLPGHGLQHQSRLKFVGHLPVPPRRTCFMPQGDRKKWTPSI